MLSAIIIAIVGSRRRKDEENVRETVRTLYSKHGDKLIIVSGGCVGVDSWAEDEARKLNVRVRIFKPDLKDTHNYYETVSRYYDRNEKIAEYAIHGIIAFVAKDRKGGTENTLFYARKLGRIITLK